MGNGVDTEFWKAVASLGLGVVLAVILVMFIKNLVNRLLDEAKVNRTEDRRLFEERQKQDREDAKQREDRLSKQIEQSIETNRTLASSIDRFSDVVEGNSETLEKHTKAVEDLRRTIFSSRPKKASV